MSKDTEHNIAVIAQELQNIREIFGLYTAAYVQAHDGRGLGFELVKAFLKNLNQITIDQTTTAPELKIELKATTAQNDEKKTESGENAESKIIDGESYVSIPYICRALNVSVSFLQRCVAGNARFRLKATKVKAKYWVTEREFKRFKKLREEQQKLKALKKGAA